MSTLNSPKKHLSEPAHLFIDTIESMDQVQLEELMLHYISQNNLASRRVAWPATLGAASLAALLFLAALAGREIRSDASASEALRHPAPPSPELALPPATGGVDFANAHNGILPSR